MLRGSSHIEGATAWSPLPTPNRTCAHWSQNQPLRVALCTACPAPPGTGRRRGLPAILPVEDEVTAPPAPAPTLIPAGQRSIDYSGMDAAAALGDGAMRNVRRMPG